MSVASVAPAAAATRSLSGRDIPTLDALYEVAGAQLYARLGAAEKADPVE